MDMPKRHTQASFETQLGLCDDNHAMISQQVSTLFFSRAIIP